MFTMKPDLFYFDDFNECLSQSDASLYCMVSAQLHPKNFTNPSETWKTIEKKNLNLSGYRYDLLRHGICVPKQCWNYHETISECLGRIYDQKYENLGLETQIVEQRCEKKKSEFTVGLLDYAFLVLLGMYLIFVLFVSFWLKIKRYKKSTKDSQHVSKVQDFFSSFSVFDHTNYILNKNLKNGDYMIYIQGLRFIFSAVIISFHMFGSEAITPISNSSFAEKVAESFLVMFLAQGGMYVSPFFVISSWFMAINFFKKLQKTKIEFVYVTKSILKRYIRLTSPYALIIALHATWLVHFENGPFWKPIVAEEYEACRKNWWENLLYVNNVDFHTSRTCLLHSWHLSVEFQFNILGLLILWLLQKKPKRIFLVSGLVIIFQILLMFSILALNNWEIATKCSLEDALYLKKLNSKESQATWTTTYSKLAALVSGLSFGYLYAYHNGQIFTKKYHRNLWAITSWSMIFFPLVFSSYYMTTEYYSKSRWFAAAYGSVNQIIFVFGIGLLIFGMSQGLGGTARKVLEWSGMHTLGQLSFGAYLIHYSFMKVSAGSRKSVHYMSIFTMISQFLSKLSISYLCSLIFTSFFIIPAEKISQLVM